MNIISGHLDTVVREESLWAIAADWLLTPHLFFVFAVSTCVHVCGSVANI